MVVAVEFVGVVEDEAITDFKISAKGLLDWDFNKLLVLLLSDNPFDSFDFIVLTMLSINSELLLTVTWLLLVFLILFSFCVNEGFDECLASIFLSLLLLELDFGSFPILLLLFSVLSSFVLQISL